MRIDAHQHYWRLARGDYGWLTPDLAAIHRDFGPADLAPHRAARGIDRTILVQAAPTAAETEFLLDLAARELPQPRERGRRAPARGQQLARRLEGVGDRRRDHQSSVGRHRLPYATDAAYASASSRSVADSDSSTLKIQPSP